MTYMDFIRLQLQKAEIGQPIYSVTIAEKMAEAYQMPKEKATAAVAVALQRIMKNDAEMKLRLYQKGIYYITATTPFGDVGIRTEQLIKDKYLASDQGYETGLGFLHRIGLTTQMPKMRELVTNFATSGTRYDKKLDVRIHPPKITITAENRLYLQILDAMETMEKAPIDAENPYRMIADYIQKRELQYQRLLALAGNCYSQKTLQCLANTAIEGGTL